MIVPIKKITKREAEWLGTHYCKHSHTYLHHYDCYLQEKPVNAPYYERVGYFDLETTGFKADFAYIFSYAILDEDSGKILGRVLEPSEIRNGHFDKRLVAEMCRDLKGFHRIVVHYGGDRRFDCPFARTRSIKHGHSFPLYKDTYVSDTWLMSKNKLCLRSNRLATIAEFFGIPAKTHPLTPDVWQRASAGDQKSLDFIWAHNQEDVITTQAVYKLLEPYNRTAKTSI